MRWTNSRSTAAASPAADVSADSDGNNAMDATLPSAASNHRPDLVGGGPMDGPPPEVRSRSGYRVPA
ncbi:hypothetical protein GCM10010399_11860 [Dactylosporangium fulvum]